MVLVSWLLCALSILVSPDVFAAPVVEDEASSLVAGEAFYTTLKGVGACGEILDPSVDYYVALSPELFDNDEWCGQELCVWGLDNGVRLTVQERCAACAYEQITLSEIAFKEIANLTDGVANVTFGLCGDEVKQCDGNTVNTVACPSTTSSTWSTWSTWNASSTWGTWSAWSTWSTRTATATPTPTNATTTATWNTTTAISTTWRPTTSSIVPTVVPTVVSTLVSTVVSTVFVYVTVSVTPTTPTTLTPTTTVPTIPTTTTKVMLHGGWSGVCTGQWWEEKK